MFEILAVGECVTTRRERDGIVMLRVFTVISPEREENVVEYYTRYDANAVRSAGQLLSLPVNGSRYASPYYVAEWRHVVSDTEMPA